MVEPFVEELDTANLRGDLLWQDWVACGGAFDFYLAVVRHFVEREARWYSCRMFTFIRTAAVFKVRPPVCAKILYYP